MRWTTRILAAAGVSTLGFIVGSLSGRLAAAYGTPMAEPPVSAPPAAAAVAPVRPVGLFPRPVSHRLQEPSEAPDEVSTILAATDRTEEPDQLDAVLRADATDGDKAKQLLEVLPNLPEDAQTEAAAHIANLLPDADYAPLGSYLSNTNTPADVLDVLMADLRHRPNWLKLPWLLAVAQMPEHPKAADARELLETCLDQDYGNDWDVWRAKIAEAIKRSPE
jgi:hypothetical protein